MGGFGHYGLLAVILFLASTLHSAAGFAFGLFAVPVLLLAGWPPYQAMAVIAISVIVHGAISVWRSETKPDWKLIVGLVGIGIAAQPVGVWLLSRIVGLERAQVARIFGCLLLAVLAVKLWLRPQPREHLHPAWGVVTMLSSGVISGMSGMGGPPIVLWAMAHQWSSARMRTTLWTFFTLLSATNLGWLTWRFGRPVQDAIWLGLLLAPITLLGRLPGRWLADRLAPAQLRHLAMAILLIVALYAIFQPILAGSTP